MMEITELEKICTVYRTWQIEEVGESVFYQCYWINEPNLIYRFLSLDGCRNFIRETEDTLNIDNLFQKYVDRNEAVSFEG